MYSLGGVTLRIHAGFLEVDLVIATQTTQTTCTTEISKTHNLETNVFMKSTLRGWASEFVVLACGCVFVCRLIWCLFSALFKLFGLLFVSVVFVFVGRVFVSGLFVSAFCMFVCALDFAFLFC